MKPQAIARALALCLCAGGLFYWARLPLPWMIGPLLAMALGKSAGLELDALPFTRQTGQVVIGTVLGLYFTPHVAVEVTHYLPWMILGGAMAVATGVVGSMICAGMMGRDGRGVRTLDSATAFFGSVPGGSSEMAVLAARFGGRVDRVVFAQSFRILLVVISIPFIYRYADIHGIDPYRPGQSVVDVRGLLVLFALVTAGGVVAARLRTPNAFMLGPLAVSIALTAGGMTLSAMPGWLSAAGQLCLGWALGVKFERDFFRSAPRFMGAVAVSTVSGMVLTSIFAWGLWRLADIHPSTGVLAVAPGGIGEMCITAQAMQLGVPVVTAFHVARVVLLLLFSGMVYRRWLDARGCSVQTGGTS